MALSDRSIGERVVRENEGKGVVFVDTPSQHRGPDSGDFIGGDPLHLFRLHPNTAVSPSPSQQPTPQAAERCDAIAHAVCQWHSPQEHGETIEAAARDHPLVGGRPLQPRKRAATTICQSETNENGSKFNEWRAALSIR